MFNLFELLAKQFNKGLERDVGPAVDAIASGDIKKIAGAAYDTFAPIPVQAALYSPEAEASIVPGIAAYGRQGGVGKIVDWMRKEGKGKVLTTAEHAKLVQQSMAELAARRNPDGIRSVFLAPDGEPRLVIDDTFERLLGKEVDKMYKAGKLKLRSPADGVDPSSMRIDVKELILKNKHDTNIPLDRIYAHPNLFELSPGLATARVENASGLMRMFGAKGSYNGDKNTIYLGDSDAGRYADALDELLATIKHESTHAIQKDFGVTGGTTTARNKLLADLERSTSINPKVIEHYKKLVSDPATSDDVLHRIYRRNYGEWEAENAARYGGNTNPALYLTPQQLGLWFNK